MLPTYFPSQVFALGGGKHGERRALCSQDNSFWQRGARSHALPAPDENGSHQKRARAALPSLLPSLGQFQGLSKTCARQSGQEGKTLGKGAASYSRNKELLPKGSGRRREGFVCGPGSMMGYHSTAPQAWTTAPTGWPTSRAGNQVTRPVGGGLEAWKKRSILELSRIHYQAGQSGVWATVLSSDPGKVCLGLHTPPPPTHGNKASAAAEQ